MVPLPTSDSSETGAMTSNPVIQLPEDQFLHWHQHIAKKQEEQARQMKELQERAGQLQCENYRLRVQVEKRHDLDKRDTQYNGQAKHPVVCNKGIKLITFDDVETSAVDELSLGSSLNPSPAKSKSNKDRSHQRQSHHPTFSNFNGGTFHRATGLGQNQPRKSPGTHLLYL